MTSYAMHRCDKTRYHVIEIGRHFFIFFLKRGKLTIKIKSTLSCPIDYLVEFSTGSLTGLPKSKEKQSKEQDTSNSLANLLVGSMNRENQLRH